MAGQQQAISEPSEPSPEAAAIGWAAFDELAGSGIFVVPIFCSNLSLILNIQNNMFQTDFLWLDSVKFLIKS